MTNFSGCQVCGKRLPIDSGNWLCAACEAEWMDDEDDDFDIDELAQDWPQLPPLDGVDIFADEYPVTGE